MNHIGLHKTTSLAAKFKGEYDMTPYDLFGYL
jgi:hypothetical protein